MLDKDYRKKQTKEEKDLLFKLKEISEENKRKRDDKFYKILETNVDLNYDNMRAFSKAKHGTIKDLFKDSKDVYFRGDLPEAARLLRRLAKFITDSFYYRIEIKGDFDKRNVLNDLTGKEWLRHTKSWEIRDGKPSDIPKEIKDHPASFPPELIEHFVEFFTKEGGWVLDPFMGIGSTAVACHNLNRNCWGIEINPKYCHYGIKRIKERDLSITEFFNVKNGEAQKKPSYFTKIFNDDCRNVLKIHREKNFPPIDFCVTSPPYWDILGKSRGGVKSAHKKRIEEGLDEKYSDYENDFGNITEYQDYLGVLEKLFEDIKVILKPRGYLMIIIQNVRPKDGIMIPIAWDMAKRLSKTYLLRQEFIWCQNQKFMGIWGYPTTYVSNVHHHYCLVLQKQLSEKKDY